MSDAAEQGKRLEEGSIVSVPSHVAHREFPTETVVLNLKSGRYHGVNPTGGQMLEALERAHTFGQAVDHLAERYDVPRARLEADLRRFCEGLAERGLIDVGADGPG